MKKIFGLNFLALLLLITACSKSDDVAEEESNLQITVDDEINHFIRRGLNIYYLWQEDVPDLADDRFSDDDEIYNYFRKYNSPEETFDNLLFQKGVVDRFSWIVDDYVALENSFQGINTSNGMEFGLVRYSNSNTNVFGYVRYVVPNSDADTKEVKRGMIFNSIDGTQITDSNFRDLLFSENASYSIGLASYNNGNPITNNKSISLSKSQLQENPVAIAEVIDAGTTKVGYLMYNQFSSSFDQQLNQAFGKFKGENIKNLVVDLRYNGGGSVRTATYLGSMITGQFTGSLYSKQIWNQRVTNDNNPNDFLTNFPDKIVNRDSSGKVILEENINSLNLDKVYFIVSGSSASASELVINSLSSYIDVVLIGTKTVGKQVGSITLYDSNSLFRDGDNLNSKHTYAMQPLVLEITNKDGVNYPDGIEPSITLPGEKLAENIDNLGVLGERSDPLLDRAISLITGSKKSSNTSKRNNINLNEMFNSKLATPSSNNMYVKLKN